MNEENVKKMVRKGYAKIAKTESSCCAQEISEGFGYSKDELASVPEGANMSLGCGNPLAFASLKHGETVVDLGSGGGLDCFLAANKVGEEGHVIGVDMTPEMIDRARKNCRKSEHRNVEFRLGEIENLPVADNTADVVISNCVINLSPNKRRVFEESFRVLKPGGRLMISDIVLLGQLPEALKESTRAYIGCVSGAVQKHEYLKMIRDAGFTEVKVLEEKHFPIEYIIDDPTTQTIVKKAKLSDKAVKEFADRFAKAVASVRVYSIKPN